MLFIVLSHISLTAHLLNENFKCKHRVWHCREMVIEHTGKNICNYIQYMLSSVNITLDNIHVFLRDNTKTLKNTNKTKGHFSYLKFGYKVELNISYTRKTEKAKISCLVLCD